MNAEVLMHLVSTASLHHGFAFSTATNDRKVRTQTIEQTQCCTLREWPQ